MGECNTILGAYTLFCIGILDSTVDSAYLQVVFVRENIAIKQLAQLPESSIQTGSLTELQMQTILLFY